MVWTWFVFALHLLGAAFWIGGMGFALLALRPALPMLEPAQRLALHAAVLKRFFLIVWHAMPVMLATGYILTDISYPNMPAPWELHAMAGLGHLMAAIFLVIFFGPWAQVRRAMAAGDNAAAAAGFARIRLLVTVNFVIGLLTVLAAAWES